MLRDDLLNMLNEHRQKSGITCEKSCICWDLERILCEFDQDQQAQSNTGLQADVCETCGGIEMVREWGKWVDCPTCQPAPAAKA